MASPSDSPSALFDALLQANVDPGLAMKAAEETRIDTFRIEVNARFDNMDTRFDAMQTTMDTHYGATKSFEMKRLISALKCHPLTIPQTSGTRRCPALPHAGPTFGTFA